MIHPVSPLWLLRVSISSTETERNESNWCQQNKYLLLTEFEVCTVSYGSRFFPFDLRLTREEHGPLILGGKKRESVTYGTDREDAVSEIFII